MPRPLRLDIAGIPQHIVQRGNNRMPCFLRDQDYRTYLRQLSEACIKHSCDIHAYVLMTNHVHLLVTPRESGGISKMMQSLGRRYVMYFNRSHERTGTLWEGRFKSSLVDSNGYVLACYRYIECNPVRASMVTLPEDYPWSSYRSNAHGKASGILVPHATYLSLSADPQRRSSIYRKMFDEVLAAQRTDEIRAHLQQQRALGDAMFQQAVASELGHAVHLTPRGRPRKADS